MSDGTRMLIAGVVAMVLVAAVLIAALVVALKVTEADRTHKTVVANACRTVEDQSLRTLCLAVGP